MKTLLIVALLGIALCSKASDVVKCAKDQLGKPYVYGAEGPSNFDCSGLVRYCYLKVGVSLPHKASEQAKRGTTVKSYKEADLLFFNSHGNTIDTINHVAIYIGNNRYIEAPYSGQVVRTTKMGRTVFLAKRIL